MNSKRILCTLVIAIAAACGDTTSFEATQLTFDRPVDIAFACYGSMRVTNGGAADPAQEIATTAMPPSACEIYSRDPRSPEAPKVPFGQEDLPPPAVQFNPPSWYGLILEQGPGTVAIATYPAVGDGASITVTDADVLTPGKNSISVGEDPVAIVTDRAGCHALTANAGSCDLSVLDIPSALDRDPAVKVDRLAVVTASGAPMRARPAAMVSEPSIDLVGAQCTATPTGTIYVAYPSCHLVAAIDAATGTITGGIQFDATGVPTIVDGNVSCPDECGAAPAITPGVRPVALDLERDPRSGNTRLVIGADNSSSLTVVEIGEQDMLPDSLTQVALEDPSGTLGVTRLALSPEIGVGGTSGFVDDEGAVGGEFQFIYAVATDNTVRVADILDQSIECDTQADPRFVRALRAVRQVSCMGVGDPTTPPRRAGARGPGIELPARAIPLSVDFVRSYNYEALFSVSPGTLIGTYGIVTAATGGTYVINVDDDANADLFVPASPLAVPVTTVIAHQLRQSISRMGGIKDVPVDAEDQDPTLEVNGCEYNGPGDANGLPFGNPRAATSPTRVGPAGALAPEKITQAPSVRQVTCRGGEGLATQRAVSVLNYTAPDEFRDEAFPDLGALPREENWSMVWEGSLSNDGSDADIDGPGVRTSELRIDSAGVHLLDQQRPFCDAGVEVHDVVQLRGCDPAVGDADCAAGYRCYVHPQSVIQGFGSCVRDDEADRIADACKDFFTSLRRFTVLASTAGELLLAPRRYGLRTSPVSGCTSDAQCESLADYALKLGSSQHPFADTTAADPRTWTCTSDSTRAPNVTGKRCVMRCDATADCAGGTVCQGAIPGQPMAGYCMEGVTPPQVCVNAAQRYELRAGDAFAVVGTRTGYVHPIIADASGRCVRDPLANPLQVGRFPLAPPACDPTTDPITGLKADGTPDLNPCTRTVTQADVVPNYGADCTLGTPTTNVVERQADSIRFRNRAFSIDITNPTYPGDARCIVDRGGTLGDIPMVVPGYQIGFRQVAGLVPVTVAVPSVFPVKVTRGPANSVWILDEGDFLSTTSGVASTRGKVFRFSPRLLSQITPLE